MFKEIKKLLREDKKLQWILFAGFILQVIVSIKAIGFSTFDQHFSIIEFSSYQLGNEHAANYAVELQEKLRPTLQVYMFSAYYQLCIAAGIKDPYTQLTILRILLGLVMFIAFNLIAIHYFKNEKRNILYWVLLILNFSWIFPYTRTLYSSEMLSGLFFFIPAALYDYKKGRTPGILFLIGIGFLFGLSFYFRYQISLALIGFGIWLVFFEKKFHRLLPLFLGFSLALLFNFYLDSRFYDQWIFTPYQHFYHNIVEDKASDYGHQSFLRYIGVLIGVITAPPFSIVIFIFIVIAYFKKFSHPIFLSTLLFIVGHSFIGHKEERFLFPIFGALPLLAGWSLPYLINFYQHSKRWLAGLIRVLFIITIIVNFILLGLFTIIPYSQSVYFGYKLKKKFIDSGTVIFCLYRTPYETVSGVPMTFYQKAIKGFSLKKVYSPDSLRQLTASGMYIATTYNEIKPRMQMLDSLGYKPVDFSSPILWKINRFLQSKGKPTVNDSWVLYRKE
jgi:phosphatidylinositol glycan class B